MSDRELVASYIDGQVGRRAFIRRLVQSGVSLGAAMSYASVLGAKPAWATHNGQPDLYEQDRLIKVSFADLTPNVVNLLRGGLVQWDYALGPPPNPSYLRLYTTTDQLGFIQTLLNEGHRVVRFYAAGTFPYSVEVHKRETESVVTHHGRVQSAIRLSKAKVLKGARVTVSWATKTAPSAFVYDVEIKRPGADAYTTWRTGVTAANQTFRPPSKGTYSFRARLRRVSNQVTSGWSPKRSLTVV